jgi:RimJ/RimL family protein N-acetyltransferase
MKIEYTQYNSREQILQLYLKRKHDIDVFYITVGAQTNFLSYDTNNNNLDLEYVFEPSDFMIIAELIEDSTQLTGESGLQSAIAAVGDVAPKPASPTGTASSVIIGIITITNGKKKKNRHVGTLGVVVSIEYCNNGIGTNLINKVLKYYTDQYTAYGLRLTIGKRSFPQRGIAPKPESPNLPNNLVSSSGRASIVYNIPNMLCKKIQLSVRTDNHRAVHLYKKLGFIIEGELKNDTYILNEYYNTYIMAYYLHSKLGPKGLGGAERRSD